MTLLIPYIGWFAFGAMIGFCFGVFAVCLIACLYRLSSTYRWNRL